MALFSEKKKLTDLSEKNEKNSEYSFSLFASKCFLMDIFLKAMTLFFFFLMQDSQVFLLPRA